MRHQSKFRVWITLSSLPLIAESLWETVIEDLEEHSQALGPILSWDSRANRGLVVFALDSGNKAGAARVSVDAVAESLDSSGQGYVYPARIEVEPRLGV
jgi:hypothetical protein